METANTGERMILEDPSEFRPDIKDKSKYRDFRVHNAAEGVVKTYYEMHTNQTLKFASSELKKWSRLDKAEMNIFQALEMLNSLIDESDPDVDFPNSLHAYQTAEAIRKQHPDKDWFHLVGLMHDLGKVLAVWGEPQWAVVGDTFVVGCKPAPSVVFGLESFADNTDCKDEKLFSKLGIYQENCGLDNVTMSWGHDEYLYRVLTGNKCCLPEEALYIIRFHSFYPWHTGNDYEYLCCNKDQEMKAWVKEFNQFDLYTKCPNFPDIEEIKPYYESLVAKYCPGLLKW